MLVFVASADLLRAQTELENQALLPPVYTEAGVRLDLAVVSDSVITFVTALQLVVSRHPQVTAVRAQVAAAQGRLQQSRYRPNPELSAEVEDFGRKTGGGPAQTTIGVEQNFELFGKRGSRMSVAEAELSAEQFAAEQSLLDLYREVAEFFVMSLGAQENVILARQRLELALKIERAVEIKVTDGAVPKAELYRAQSSAKLAEIDLASAEASAAQQRLALATLWGSSSPDFRVVGALDDWLTVPPKTPLELRIDDNPELLGLLAQVRAREADIRLAQSIGKPDVSLGAGYRRLHDDGSNSYLVWAAFPLPLFNRNQGSVAEASARLKQVEAELSMARRRLESDVRLLLANIETRRQQIKQLREQVIPPAQQALEEIDLAYRMGSQPFINVLDAQRTLFELQGMLIDALIAAAQTAAEIEQLTGHSLNPVRR